MKKKVVVLILALVILSGIFYYFNVNLKLDTSSQKEVILNASSYMNTLNSVLPLDKIELPKGFSIELFAYPVSGARSMSLSPSGTLFVGTREKGNVYAIKDNETIILASNLNMPNGVAFKDGDLFVAEVNRVIIFKNIEMNLRNPTYHVLYDNYPNESYHGWKFIRFGPDNNLYIPIGAPCNVCADENSFDSITRINSEGTNFEIFAKGIRNTVGFDWHPETKELWFTDNGRDLLGDDIPPDELNRAPVKGMNFGFPYCFGKSIQDPTFNSIKCSEFTAPEVELGPHVASLGMRFYTADRFPSKYKNGIFIAEHGSWNRQIPLGYRITFVNPELKNYEIFAQGWLQGSEAWGRPVDIEIMPDGSILVSDDKAGAIYKISYSANF